MAVVTTDVIQGSCYFNSNLLLLKNAAALKYEDLCVYH